MNTDQKYKAVVIGSSAGGLAALSAILEKLPSSFPLPIIVVQHRVKDQRDLLEEVLQSKCSLKVKQADEKESIVEGFVYTAPPDYHLLIEKEHEFSLASDEYVNFSRPSIDVLFESAAFAYRQNLIAIILTGANSDGSNGIVAVKKAGGVTIAQDPQEARYPAMPLAAIKTNAINYIWPLLQIQNYLMKLSPL